MRKTASRIGEKYGVSAYVIKHLLKLLGHLDGRVGEYNLTSKGEEHCSKGVGWAEKPNSPIYEYDLWDDETQNEIDDMIENDSSILDRAKEELREERRLKKQEEEENDPFKDLLEGNNDENDSEDDDYEIETSNNIDALKYGLIAAAVFGSFLYVRKCIKDKKIFNPFSRKNKKNEKK
ncbi:MAG: hypothetical protein Q4A05_02635 [Ruminococcus sp.]|nr:hypothetical protein [Ruminococcus sp.]